MDRNRTLERVRNLINMAENTSNDEEADAFRQKADQMMLDHAIEEAELEATRSVGQRTTPELLKLDLIRYDSPVRIYIIRVAGYLADHCRVKLVIHNYMEDVFEGLADMQIAVSAVGYESDLRYFELLLTVVRLHFASMVDPRPDPSKSFDENCYNMHEAGVTYRKMAHMLFPKEIDKWSPEKEVRRMGGRCKAAYKRECKRLGKVPVAIPNPDIYQKSFARAYSHRVWIRLLQMQGKREGGTTTALVRRIETVEEKFHELFPELGEIGAPEEDNKVDYRGSAAGYQAGGEVDLSGGRRSAAGGASQAEIG